MTLGSLWGHSPLIRVDLSYFYKTGEIIHPLTRLFGERKRSELFLDLHIAYEHLEAQIKADSLRSAHADGVSLLNIIKPHLELTKLEHFTSTNIEDWETFAIADQARKFEASLVSELRVAPIYAITPKGGYNVDILTMQPLNAFPPELASLVPEAKYDAEQAAKCLAFEVPTAAGFHLHRMNEQIVHLYWDAKADGRKRPRLSSVGEYIKEMKAEGIGEPNVLFLQEGIQKLYRNPLIHEDNQEVLKLTPQEAIDLFPIIATAINAMLPAIKEHKLEKDIIKAFSGPTPEQVS